MAKTTRRIERNGRFSPYAYLYETAWNAFESAQTSESGKNHHLLSATIFTAFTLEAYLNHIGDLQIPTWSMVESKLGPNDKLDFIARTIGFDVDRGHRPFSAFRILFRIRDFFAHGKTQYYDDVIEDHRPRDADTPDFDPEQINNLSEQSVRRSLDDMKHMIEFIHKHAADPDDHLWLMSEGMTGKRKVLLSIGIASPDGGRIVQAGSCYCDICVRRSTMNFQFGLSSRRQLVETFLMGARTQALLPRRLRRGLNWLDVSMWSTKTVSK
jgi:hypothetical protein